MAEIEDDDYEGISRKLSWQNAVAFIIFWLMIYISIAVPQSGRLPQALMIRDENEMAEAFITERAKNVLRAITNVGARVVGSAANELVTLEVLKAEMEHIKSELSSHRHRIDVDIQIASGNFSINKRIFVYRSIKNFIVKLSPLKSDIASDDCLLLNSHFDTVPQSPGAGDDASMVAVMFEVLRVLAKSDKPLKHSIVFLFNGAEETGWMGAHAFVTQHKWAKNCRVFINLDAAGWGGQTLLFQMAPDQDLLIQYYRSVPHPFATTLAEELFQTGLLLSNTDFRILRKFGNLPGFDMALISDSYVYHTKYDRFEQYSLHSLQHAGNNVLALVRSLLEGLDKFGYDVQPPQEATDKMIYYDFFGYFLIVYPSSFGFMLNISVCLIAGVGISLSIFEFSNRSNLNFIEVLTQFGTTMLIQIFSLILASALAILVAALTSTYNCALSWYSQKWLLLGLYFCPVFFGMLILPALTLKHIDYKSIFMHQKIKLLLHAHCTWLILFTLILTMFEVRSAFLGMIAIAFYALAIWTNLSTDRRGSAHSYWFLVPILVSQVVPFTYFTALTHTFYTFMVPFMGRSGVKFKPELLMAGIAILMSILFAGFILPIFLIFQKTLKIAGLFAFFTFFSIFVAFTPLGFPFKAESAVQRFDVFHEHHIIHSFGKETSENFFIRVQIVDRSIKNLHDFSKIFAENKEIFAAFEGSISSFVGGDLSICIPIARSPAIARSRYPKLEVLNIIKLASNPKRCRFDFRLTGPLRMNAILRLFNIKIIDWSFDKEALKTTTRSFNENNEKLDFPLHLKFVSAEKKDGPFHFHITFEHKNQNFSKENEHYFDFGIYGQWYDEQSNYNHEFRRFIDAFPNYAFVDDYLMTFEKWSFEV